MKHKDFMVRTAGKNFQKKTIAVFGVSGNIGRKFAVEAVARGATVIGFVRDIRKVSRDLNMTRDIKIIQGDITKRRDVWKVFHGKKIDATINFAASFSADFLESRAVNVYGEQHVLDGSKKFGVKRHVYISTVATQMRKTGAYRDTKLEAEKIVKKSVKSGFDSVILRYANVLGTSTWDQPFKIILPYLRLGIPKVPTDARRSAFYYVTMDTAVEAALNALSARPNQTITVFDGTISIGEYLWVMEKAYNVRLSFLPGRLLQLMANLFGKYFPFIQGLYAGAEFMANPPIFENATMKKELHIKPRHFNQRR